MRHVGLGFKGGGGAGAGPACRRGGAAGPLCPGSLCKRAAPTKRLLPLPCLQPLALAGPGTCRPWHLQALALAAPGTCTVAYTTAGHECVHLARRALHDPHFLHPARRLLAVHICPPQRGKGVSGGLKDHCTSTLFLPSPLRANGRFLCSCAPRTCTPRLVYASLHAGVSPPGLPTLV